MSYLEVVDGGAGRMAQVRHHEGDQVHQRRHRQRLHDVPVDEGHDVLLAPDLESAEGGGGGDEMNMQVNQRHRIAFKLKN